MGREGLGFPGLGILWLRMVWHGVAAEGIFCRPADAQAGIGRLSLHHTLVGR